MTTLLLLSLSPFKNQGGSQDRYPQSNAVAYSGRFKLETKRGFLKIIIWWNDELNLLYDESKETFFDFQFSTYIKQNSKLYI